MSADVPTDGRVPIPVAMGLFNALDWERIVAIAELHDWRHARDWGYAKFCDALALEARVTPTANTETKR